MNGSVLYDGNTLLSGAINVNTGGNIEPLEVEVTENGTRTINAPVGIDGYNPITISTNVPSVEPILDDITITENGTYTPPTGTDGYDEINVNVPPITPVLDDITITENGTYTPPTGTDGYDEIIVNVPSLPYYEYETAFDGKIVVRKSVALVNGKIKVQTLWFFNGWTKDASDVAIPSNLIPYVPTTSNTVIMTSAYSDNTSTTQDGWIGFLYPSDPSSRMLRTWSIDKGSLQAGTFWGVLDIDGSDEQTNVWFDPYDV